MLTINPSTYWVQVLILTSLEFFFINAYYTDNVLTQVPSPLNRDYKKTFNDIFIQNKEKREMNIKNYKL
jgi:hypothetical protein